MLLLGEDPANDMADFDAVAAVSSIVINAARALTKEVVAVQLQQRMSRLDTGKHEVGGNERKHCPTS